MPASRHPTFAAVPLSTIAKLNVLGISCESSLNRSFRIGVMLNDLQVVRLMLPYIDPGKIDGIPPDNNSILCLAARVASCPCVELLLSKFEMSADCHLALQNAAEMGLRDKAELFLGLIESRGELSLLPAIVDDARSNGRHAAAAMLEAKSLDLAASITEGSYLHAKRL